MNKQQIALQIFFPSMFLCAFVALSGIWLEAWVSETYFKLIPTFFIIGFAAFISWAVFFALEIKQRYLQVGK